MNEAPILDAVRREDGSGLKVWCVHCDNWHLHGDDDGHRVAHCTNPESPYRATGYELRLVEAPGRQGGVSRRSRI